MRRKKPVNYVLEKKYIIDEELDSIDFDLRDELNIGDDDDEIGRISNYNKMCWAGESHPINIDRMITLLKKFKTTHKCRYVEIMYHEDHIGYCVNGLNIYKYDEDSEEAETHLKSKKDEEKIYREFKIKKLETELKQLKQ